MISIRYKCACHKDEQEVFIAPRAEAEPLDAFMDRVKYAISDAHAETSPRCRRTTMEYAKIPCPPEDAGQIGQMR